VSIVLKSGSLNLLEPSGPVKACNGIAVPYFLATLCSYFACFVNCDLLSNPALLHVYCVKATMNIIQGEAVEYDDMHITLLMSRIEYKHQTYRVSAVKFQLIHGCRV
jgi:hypothetical protein